MQIVNTQHIDIGILLEPNEAVQFKLSMIDRIKRETFNMKSLVVYFSWGGNTRAVAEDIARKTGSDLLELKVADEYPAHYRACVQRVEREGTSCTPELATPIPDLSAYDTIFVGSPNWWGTIANPLRSFLKSADLTGKTVAPFMTHGTSGMCIQDIPRLCQGSHVVEGLSVFNRYQVSTKTNTPDNMGDYGSLVDAWLRRCAKQGVLV